MYCIRCVFCFIYIYFVRLYFMCTTSYVDCILVMTDCDKFCVCACLLVSFLFFSMKIDLIPYTGNISARAPSVSTSRFERKTTAYVAGNAMSQLLTNEISAKPGSWKTKPLIKPCKACFRWKKMDAEHFHRPVLNIRTSQILPFLLLLSLLHGCGLSS